MLSFLWLELSPNWKWQSSLTNAQQDGLGRETVRRGIAAKCIFMYKWITKSVFPNPQLLRKLKSRRPRNLWTSCHHQFAAVHMDPRQLPNECISQYKQNQWKVWASWNLEICQIILAAWKWVLTVFSHYTEHKVWCRKESSHLDSATQFCHWLALWC